MVFETKKHSVENRSGSGGVHGGSADGFFGSVLQRGEFGDLMKLLLADFIRREHAQQTFQVVWENLGEPIVGLVQEMNNLNVKYKRVI